MNWYECCKVEDQHLWTNSNQDGLESKVRYFVCFVPERRMFLLSAICRQSYKWNTNSKRVFWLFSQKNINRIVGTLHARIFLDTFFVICFLRENLTGEEWIFVVWHTQKVMPTKLLLEITCQQTKQQFWFAFDCSMHEFCCNCSFICSSLLQQPTVGKWIALPMATSHWFAKIVVMFLHRAFGVLWKL